MGYCRPIYGHLTLIGTSSNFILLIWKTQKNCAEILQFALLNLSPLGPTLHLSAPGHSS